MKRRNLRNILLMCGLAAITLGVSSCNDNEEQVTGPTVLSYSMTKNDAISIQNLVNRLGVNYSEDTTFLTSNYNVAAIVGEKIFATNEGQAIISLYNSGELSASINLTVVGYETYEEVSYSNGCSYSGYLIDFLATPYATKGQSYNFNLSISNQSDQTFYVVSSNTSIFDYEFRDTGHYFVANAVGQAQITIYNATNNAILIQFVVTVTAPYETAEEYTYALTRPDSWVGLGWFNYRDDITYLTFLPDGTGILSGSDAGYEFIDITFNYTYDTTFSDADRVAFSLTNVQTGGDVSFSIGTVCLFKHGFEVMLYSTSDSLMEAYRQYYNN